jgi:redox-sensitive bicupin YhaK (pirin superfamily)
MLTRRAALKLMATSSAALAAVACSQRPSTRKAEAMHSEQTSKQGDPAAPVVLGVAKLGAPPWPTRDPFLFCVHHDDHYPEANGQFGPAASLEGRNLGQDFEGKDGWRMYHGLQVPGFPQHPHRGFETVTVVRRGLLDHADSLGAAARYGRGDVQWLTAGGGIQHAEMFPLLDDAAPNPVELFQLWLNLPRRDKMVPPYFSMLWADTIPKRVLRDDRGRETELTVVAGRYEDLAPPAPPPNSWAARPESAVAIWTLKLAADARVTLPAAPAGVNRTLYFFRGRELAVAGTSVAGSHLVELRSDQNVLLENGAAEAELLLLQGRPIAEPTVQHGPFVMNTPDEIRKAYADYQRTRFGGWPWPSTAPVHGTEGRFARHADGRTERPA